VQFVAGDLEPAALLAATSSAESPNGILVRANVRLRETIRLAVPTTGAAEWRTRGRLPSGTYYVQVLAVETDGVTDCPPRLGGCAEHASNLKRVTVP
jgi:hypothetical protein